MYEPISDVLNDLDLIINASSWNMVDEGNSLCYWVGHYSQQDPSKVFQPFAWVRFNKITHLITAARDHFGQEPFYYAIHNGHFIFGSTIPDVLKNLPRMPKFSRHLIRDCFMRYPADDPLDDPPYTTETYYQGIFRVTPGHYLYLVDKQTREHPFWKMDLDKEAIHYHDEEDYINHFSVLLDEAIKVTTGSQTKLAMEFSGGLDSSTILVACQIRGLEPALFTHIPPTERVRTAEDENVLSIIKQLNLHTHHPINATDFEPIRVFTQYAQLFGGPPPNLNGVLSNNVHQAVKDHGFSHLLSGYGGDDCVSLLVPLAIAKQSAQRLRQHEYDLLFGSICHEFRMRLEYSAVCAKAMGINYIYPLLYPPLIEYCFSLPYEQKLKNERMRCTATSYLLRHIKSFHLSTKEGAAVPSAMQKCREYYRMGQFEPYFQDLPFQRFIDQRQTNDDKMLLKIHAFMVKEALQMAC